MAGRKTLRVGGDGPLQGGGQQIGGKFEPLPDLQALEQAVLVERAPAEPRE